MRVTCECCLSENLANLRVRGDVCALLRTVVRFVLLVHRIQNPKPAEILKRQGGGALKGETHLSSRIDTFGWPKPRTLRENAFLLGAWSNIYSVLPDL